MAKIPINLKEGTLVQDSLIVGIDLGTTHSLIAYMKDGKPITIKDETSRSSLVPSIVHFGRDGSILVGEAAKSHLISEPERTIFSVKRLLGKSYGDIASFKSFFGYQIIDDGTESLVKIKVDDRFYNPIELSALILKELKNRGEELLQQTISKAVITVPAYFNDAQRQATRDAGKLAGLDVLRIVNEPTAASLAYGLQDQQDQNSQRIAVYDLGGGTFDISILQIEGGVFEVLATHGNTFLGGDDFDRAILNHWKDQNQFPDADLGFMQELRLAAEEAKKTLGTRSTYHNKIGGYDLALDRATFENLILPLVNETISACNRALKDAQLSIDQIDHVVLVGGSTRVPLVKRRIAETFAKEPLQNLDPDEVVACGAAIQADILGGNQKDMLLLDITPLSLGIETVGGLMDVILPRNSKIPARVARNYTTSVDGQKNLKVAVFQGERDLVADNRKLGEFILRDIPPMPAGIPKIEIAFLINADGILIVRARELRSGKEQEVEIRSTYGITEEEMAKMLLESLQHAQEDIAEKAIREAINEANHVIIATERFMKQNENFLDGEVVKQLHLKMEHIKAAVNQRDKNNIEKAMEDLNTFAEPLAHEAMDRNVGEAMKGQKI